MTEYDYLIYRKGPTGHLMANKIYSQALLLDATESVSQQGGGCWSTSSSTGAADTHTRTRTPHARARTPPPQEPKYS